MYSQGNCLTCFNDHENVQTVYATQWNHAIVTLLNTDDIMWTVLQSTIDSCVHGADGS